MGICERKVGGCFWKCTNLRIYWSWKQLFNLVILITWCILKTLWGYWIILGGFLSHSNHAELDPRASAQWTYKNRSTFSRKFKKKAGFGRRGGSNWVSRTTSMSHIVSKHDCQHFGYMSRIYTLVVLDTFQRIRNSLELRQRRHEARPKFEAARAAATTHGQESY